MYSRRRAFVDLAKERRQMEHNERNGRRKEGPYEEIGTPNRNILQPLDPPAIGSIVVYL